MKKGELSRTKGILFAIFIIPLVGFVFSTCTGTKNSSTQSSSMNILSEHQKKKIIADSIVNLDFPKYCGEKLGKLFEDHPMIVDEATQIQYDRFHITCLKGVQISYYTSLGRDSFFLILEVYLDSLSYTNRCIDVQAGKLGYHSNVVNN